VFDTVQPGDEFFEKAGFHSGFATWVFSVFREGMNDVRLVFCTFPSIDAARQIGTALVEKQLAACVNLIPGVESIYRWQGELENTLETLAIFKTSAGAFPQFEQALAELHPFEVPEIVAIEPSAVAETYAAWVLAEVRMPASES
jgi:periplasmic divalent cation tolerance protein